MAPGCAAAAEALVHSCCPAARSRPRRWQADGGGGDAAAPGGGRAGGTLGGGAGAPEGAAAAEAHLSFSIPRGAADVPALFAALEQGRWAVHGVAGCAAGAAGGAAGGCSKMPLPAESGGVRRPPSG